MQYFIQILAKKRNRNEKWKRGKISLKLLIWESWRKNCSVRKKKKVFILFILFIFAIIANNAITTSSHYSSNIRFMRAWMRLNAIYSFCIIMQIIEKYEINATQIILFYASTENDWETFFRDINLLLLFFC